MQKIGKAGVRIRKRRAPRQDGIPPEVVKLIIQKESERIRRVLNRLLTVRAFPLCWKTARLLFLPKPIKNNNEKQTFRPICLLNVTGKVYEQIVKPQHKEDLAARGMSRTGAGWVLDKATRALWTCRRTFCKNWGLTHLALRMTYLMLYTMMVIPIHSQEHW